MLVNVKHVELHFMSEMCFTNKDNYYSYYSVTYFEVSYAGVTFSLSEVL